MTDNKIDEYEIEIKLFEKHISLLKEKHNLSLRIDDIDEIIEEIHDILNESRFFKNDNDSCALELNLNPKKTNLNNIKHHDINHPEIQNLVKNLMQTATKNNENDEEEEDDDDESVKIKKFHQINLKDLKKHYKGSNSHHLNQKTHF